MELRHIRYFLEVAETLNFSRAAERLKVAQPALSKQIRDLEAELGGKLFHRTTVKVSLTEMGEYFRQQTRKILMQIDIAATGAQQLARGASGTLKIGCDWRFPGIPIAKAARLFHESYPRVDVNFVEVPSHAQVAQVRNHTLDIGFVPAVFVGSAEDIELRPLFKLKLKVLFPVEHPYAKRESVSLMELKDERWLMLDYETFSGARVVMAQILQFNPKYSATTSSVPGLIAHVAAGHGIGLFAERERQQIDASVVAVDTDSTPVDVFAIWLKNATSPSVAYFIGILDQIVNERKAPAQPRAARTQH